MKKILSLILACLMLTGCLVSCAKEAAPDDKPDAIVDYDGQDSVLPDKDWEGKELKIMACVNPLVGNIFQPSDFTNVVEAETYSRNTYLEEKYNFTIKCQAAAFGQWPSDVVRTEAASGESSYDLILDAMRSLKVALSQFLYSDLSELDYIDWNAKGWLKDANDSLDIMGYRFVCTGDANLYEKSGAILMYYNRNIMSSLADEDIRQVALDGNWTMDYLWMRGAEMVLIEAEALAHQGKGAEAAVVLKELMAQRDPSWDMAAVDVESILLQRRLELIGEGFAYFDLKRNHRGFDRTYEGNNHLDGYAIAVDANDPSWTYQIPQSEIQENIYITDEDQNP